MKTVLTFLKYLNMLDMSSKVVRENSEQNFRSIFSLTFIS